MMSVSSAISGDVVVCVETYDLLGDIADSPGEKRRRSVSS